MSNRGKIINDLTDLENIMVARQEICPAEELQYWIALQESLADALELLKEQEAVEPTLIREGRNKYCNDFVCPSCDNELHYGQNYCSECGRAVKWE